VAPLAEDDLGFLDVAGLDYATGLKRVAGNRVLYLRLLRQFCEEEADAATRITVALDADDLVTAERVAHTLKGVAGSIGLVQLQAAAALLEKPSRKVTATRRRCLHLHRNCGKPWLACTRCWALNIRVTPQHRMRRPATWDIWPRCWRQATARRSSIFSITQRPCARCLRTATI